MIIAHVAWYRRSAPDFHAGGVPMFGHYFERVLGARQWSWGDYNKPLPKVDEPTAARLLGEWLEDTGRLATVSCVVTDGFWGRGISRVPVVSVAHGTWRGIARATGSATAGHLGEIQAEEYRRRPVVAVSVATARELAELYDVRAAAVIPNAVDTDEFIPFPQDLRARPLVLYPSDAPSKGGNVVRALRQVCPQWDFRTIGGAIGQEAERISEADAFLAPSMCEGNSYAVLQALSCGVPVVASPVGVFGDIETRPPGRIVSGGAANLEGWAAALADVMGNRALLSDASRAWALAHASLPQWAEKWRSFLEGLEGE